MGSLLGFDAEKNVIKRTHVRNLKIRIEETSLWKARTVIKENVKYQNIKLSKYPIAVALNGEVELVLLLTGSKKSWMYQLLLFIFSLRYLGDHD